MNSKYYLDVSSKSSPLQLDDLKSFDDLSSKSNITIQTLQEANDQLNNRIIEFESNFK